ncbi:MAG: retropepsin-like domain-containing protein [Oligoflexales bacterium]|nr:retropepsin-like domain-containing protein [Oligoflexales bacterium]
MPLIEAGFNSDQEKLQQYGPTTQVIVCSFEIPDKVEELKTETVWALIDTGASHSMIDSQLASKLGLVPIDKSIVAGVSGAHEHTVYLTRIVSISLEIEQYGSFMAANLKEGGVEHEVLLGRDFLSNTIMIYDGLRAQVTIASPKKL